MKEIYIWTSKIIIFLVKKIVEINIKKFLNRSKGETSNPHKSIFITILEMICWFNVNGLLLQEVAKFCMKKFVLNKKKYMTQLRHNNLQLFPSLLHEMYVNSTAIKIKKNKNI